MKLLKKIILIFNYEFNVDFKFFPIGTIIGTLSKSLFYTIFISYVLYNVMVSANPNPNPNNILDSSKKVIYGDRINIVTNQSEVLASYYTFLTDFVTLDLGDVKGKKIDRIEEVVRNFSTTLLLIILGLFASMILSLVMLFLRKYKLLKNTIVNLLIKLSYFHISILLILVTTFIFQLDITNSTNLFKLIFSSLIVSLGSGILVDYYALIKQEYDIIMKKDYVIFASDAGLSKFYFASKELLFNLMNITISRIPIIFGGLVIIEYYLSDVGMSGISMFILSRLSAFDYYSIFCSIFICTIFFTFFYFLSASIQRKIIN